MVEGQPGGLVFIAIEAAATGGLEFSAGDGAKTIPGLAAAAQHEGQAPAVGVLPENSMRRAPLAK